MLIISTNSKKLSKKEITKNSEDLMKVVKGLVDGIVDNSKESDLQIEIVEFLSNITADRKFIVNGFLSKFEVNRLNFSQHGALS